MGQDAPSVPAPREPSSSPEGRIVVEDCTEILVNEAVDRSVKIERRTILRIRYSAFVVCLSGLTAIAIFALTRSGSAPLAGLLLGAASAAFGALVGSVLALTKTRQTRDRLQDLSAAVRHTQGDR